MLVVYLPQAMVRYSKDFTLEIMLDSNYKKIFLILIVFISATFLSAIFNKTEKLEAEIFNLKKPHKGYYESGELRFVCYDKHTGQYGRGTGVVRTFKFKRIYYDKCGNVKLIVTGKGETGCWRNGLEITEQKQKNETLICDKEQFVYPSKTDLELEIKKEKLMWF
jgi:hypothetical protein